MDHTKFFQDLSLQVDVFKMLICHEVAGRPENKGRLFEIMKIKKIISAKPE